MLNPYKVITVYPLTIYTHLLYTVYLHVVLHCSIRDVVANSLRSGAMLSPSQMQVYLRRWRPATYTVDTPHEIILDENSPAHLRRRIAEASGIPVEHVMFAKAHSSFPCKISVLDLEDDLEWNPNVSTISSMPLSIYDDGAVLYYK